MVWFVFFLAAAALVLFLAYQFVRLIVFVGVVFPTGVGVLLAGLLSLGFLAGAAGLFISYRFTQHFPIAISIGLLAGMTLLLLLGGKVISEVRGIVALAKNGVAPTPSSRVVSRNNFY